MGHLLEGREDRRSNARARPEALPNNGKYVLIRPENHKPRGRVEIGGVSKEKETFELLQKKIDFRGV